MRLSMFQLCYDHVAGAAVGGPQMTSLQSLFENQSAGSRLRGLVRIHKMMRELRPRVAMNRRIIKSVLCHRPRMHAIGVATLIATPARNDSG